MAYLNDNEITALVAIYGDCDEIEGDYFTRPMDCVRAVAAGFGTTNMYQAAGYVSDLMRKGFITLDKEDDTVWLESEALDLLDIIR